MAGSSRPQLAIYAALAVAVLLVGARFLRAGDGGDATGGPPPAFAAATTSGSPDGLGGASGATAGDQAGLDVADGARLVVNVKGAVRRPGVYRLDAGARAYDAVRRAGGLTHRADRIGVNLAARLTDGGEVVVPERGRVARVGAAGATDTTDPGGDAPLSLDLNTASEQELEQLDGVGPATAANIVAYREQHGGFASIDELDEVSGIGDAKLAAIRAQLGQ